MVEEQKNKKFYTFTFGRYESERLQRQQELYKRNLKFKFKLWGSVGGVVFVLGMIHPILMWFEYDINVFKPRMSEYLKNRFK